MDASPATQCARTPPLLHSTPTVLERDSSPSTSYCSSPTSPVMPSPVHEDKTDDHQELIHQEATPKTTKQEVDTSTKEKLDSSEDIKPMVCILVMACTNNCTK